MLSSSINFCFFLLVTHFWKELFKLASISAYFSICSFYPKIWISLWIKEGSLLQRQSEKGRQIFQEKKECLHNWPGEHINLRLRQHIQEWSSKNNKVCKNFIKYNASERFLRSMDVRHWDSSHGCHQFTVTSHRFNLST